MRVGNKKLFGALGKGREFKSLVLALTIIFSPSTVGASAHFVGLECTVKDVKVMDRYGMFYDGDWNHKEAVGTAFYVERESGVILGKRISNTYSMEKVVLDKVGSHQSYVVISHDGDLTSGVNTLHVWISNVGEIKKNGYPFIYTPDTLREFYSGTCRAK